ncbi:MAG: hypothetical protein K6C30_07670 [Bacteroidaceae bacterium]|nr:hypothetical protein [Bacteroidaceae bacterium]
MKLIHKPWIWLARFRKRKGYGVHSPSAYSFIRGVILEDTPYYAYAGLARLHPWWVRWGHFYPMKCRRLLFRLANYASPHRALLLTEDSVARAYVQAAVPRAELLTQQSVLAGSTQADFIFVDADHEALAGRLAQTMPSHGMLVVEGIRRDKETLRKWREIQQSPHTGITFDLYVYGIAFFDTSHFKQHYKVNF